MPGSRTTNANGSRFVFDPNFKGSFFFQHLINTCVCDNGAKHFVVPEGQTDGGKDSWQSFFKSYNHPPGCSVSLSLYASSLYSNAAKIGFEPPVPTKFIGLEFISTDEKTYHELTDEEKHHLLVYAAVGMFGNSEDVIRVLTSIDPHLARDFFTGMPVYTNRPGSISEAPVADVSKISLMFDQDPGNPVLQRMFVLATQGLYPNSQDVLNELAKLSIVVTIRSVGRAVVEHWDFSADGIPVRVEPDFI